MADEVPVKESRPLASTHLAIATLLTTLGSLRLKSPTDSENGPLIAERANESRHLKIATLLTTMGKVPLKSLMGSEDGPVIRRADWGGGEEAEEVKVSRPLASTRIPLAILGSAVYCPTM
jgi:hypothetical protein